MSEIKKNAKSKTETERINLDADKLWKAANTASGSKSSSTVDDLGKLGSHPSIPESSVLKVTENLKKTALETENLLAPKPIQETENPLAPNPVEDWTEVELVQDELYVSAADRITDMLVKTTRAKGELSKWIPELTYVVGCMNPDHVMDERLDKGMFFISGNVLSNMSVKQTMDWMTGPGSKVKGCGVVGCDVSLEEALEYYLEDEEVDCYACTTDSRVNMSDACPNHPETKLVFLAVAAFAKVAKWYKVKARVLQLQNKTLPHTTLTKAMDQQIFPVCSKQAIRLSGFVKSKQPNLLNAFLMLEPRQTELKRLAKLLTGDGKPNNEVRREETLATTSLAVNTHLENQKLSNHQMKMTQDNNRLNKGKRRGEEHRLSFQDIKKRKLEQVGSRSIYTTNKSTPRHLGELSGLNSGFTDLSLRQAFYEQKLSCNKSPSWMKNKEDEAVTTWTTRSWDNQFMCKECDTPHSIFDKPHFAIVVADQHMVAKVPAFEGQCICVIRLQDLSMGQLIDLTIFKIVQAALSEKRARCNDEHGACEVIQQAIERQKEIYLFLSSGTGLVIDQSGGYSYQLQRALNLVNCKSFGGARNGMFRRIIFLAPAIPFIQLPKTDSPLKEMMAKVEVEKSNAGRLITLNSSVDDNKLKTFISSTEGVMIRETTPKDNCKYSDLREHTPFNALIRIGNYTECGKQGFMQKCHLSTSKITWPHEDRSKGGALSLMFCAEYSAAVHVDLIHAISLSAVEDDPEPDFKKKTATVSRPKPQVDEFIRLRAPIRNLVSTVGDWNLACNNRTDVFDDFACYNNIKHRQPARFGIRKDWEEHASKCYDHVRSTSGRRK